MIGLLNLYKPAGPTSHDIVAGVRRRLPRGAKVGHCGTLDPFAEGVLVVCIGSATRLADYVQGQPKRYQAEVTLGATSTTDDPMGVVAPRTPAVGSPPRTETAPPTEAQVRAVLARFVGEIRQRPPSHSAVHVNGRRAYKLARKGEDLELPERTVFVRSIDLIRYEWPRMEIDVRCGGGTYIRALARDIGEAMGLGGYCSRLARTEVGVFRASDAHRPDEIDLARHLLPPRLALGDMEAIVLAEEDCRRARMGQRVARPALPPGLEGECALMDEHGELVAVAALDSRSGILLPRIVLSAT